MIKENKVSLFWWQKVNCYDVKFLCFFKKKGFKRQDVKIIDLMKLQK